MQQKTFFRHPFQLSTLFHIELWERFSFYGMKAILFIYLYYTVQQGGLGVDEKIAGGIIGAYGGAVYLSAIVGGWLADRVLGAERTLFWSGIVVMLGHIALAILPGLSGLIAGLVFVALGSGGVKSSASTMVGSLYEAPELRTMRDAGFSIFYIAINIGGLLGPLIAGYLQSTAGFHYGFGAAAVGMAFGLWRYARGRKDFPSNPVPHPLNANGKRRAGVIAAVIIGALALLIGSGTLNLANFSQVLLASVIALTVFYFVRLLTSPDIESENKRYIWAYIPLFIAVCLFWSVWAQFDTLGIWYFDKIIDRNIGSFTIPVGWLPALQSLWVILFSGVLAALWTKMGKRQPKTPLKFALSLIFVGATFLLFIPFLLSDTAMPLVVMALVVLALTIAELMISPISLSLSTKIAPKQFKTQMVALTFLAFSLGFTLSGVLFSNFFDPKTDAANQIGYYWLVAGIGIVGGAVLLLLAPVLNRLLKNID